MCTCALLTSSRRVLVSTLIVTPSTVRVLVVTADTVAARPITATRSISTTSATSTLFASSVPRTSTRTLSARSAAVPFLNTVDAVVVTFSPATSKSVADAKRVIRPSSSTIPPSAWSSRSVSAFRSVVAVSFPAVASKTLPRTITRSPAAGSPEAKPIRFAAEKSTVRALIMRV